MPPHDRGHGPFHHLASPGEVVRQFTPNWFTATMGTGILALVLNQLPLRVPGLRMVAVGLWIFDIALFALFSGLYLARWTLYFDGARRIFGHSVMSMFFGAIPMGLATIINGLITFGPPLLGPVSFADAELQRRIGPLRINISGCISACGHHHAAGIGILGVDKKGEEFFQLTLGGTSESDVAIGQLLGPSLPEAEAVVAIERLVETYLSLRTGEERFIDTYRRLGNRPFKEAVYAAA